MLLYICIKILGTYVNFFEDFTNSVSSQFNFQRSPALRIFVEFVSISSSNVHLRSLSNVWLNQQFLQDIVSDVHITIPSLHGAIHNESQGVFSLKKVSNTFKTSLMFLYHVLRVALINESLINNSHIHKWLSCFSIDWCKLQSFLNFKDETFTDNQLTGKPQKLHPSKILCMRVYTVVVYFYCYTAYH